MLFIEIYPLFICIFRIFSVPLQQKYILYEKI